MKRLLKFNSNTLALACLLASTLLWTQQSNAMQIEITTAASGSSTSAKTSATPAKENSSTKGDGMSASSVSSAASAETEAKAKAKPPASRAVNIVGYNRNIKQEHFKGLSKEVVLKMQKQLESIYQLLPDWQRDYALKGEPLNDGIVGPITLSWLQRFGFSFKVVTEGDYAEKLAQNVNRIALFAAKHKDELTILMSPEFEAWDFMQNDKQKQADFQIRRQGSDKELIELVNRFRGHRKTAPRAAPKTVIDESAFFYYKLNQNDLDILGGKDQIVQILTTLKDKEFNSSEALRVAVKQALGGRDHLVNQIWPLIERNAADFDGFLLNEAALQRLKETSEFPTAVIDELRLQGTVYFKTRELFDAFMTEKFASETLVLSEDDREAVAEAARVFDNIHLTTQAIANIKVQLKGQVQNTGIPAVLVRLLGEIKDVSYPETSLLRHAAISKMIMGIGACKMNSPTSNPYVAGLRMPDEEFELLVKDISALQAQTIDGKVNHDFDIKKAFDELRRLRLQVSQCDKSSLQNSREIIGDIYHNYLAFAIENMAKKRIPDEVVPITLKGGDCGCAIDDFAGVVYGFYPYWNNLKTPQTMNFHVLNRVAYYGLSVDNVGDLRLGQVPFDVKDGSAEHNQFIRLAHQYNSKVDWLIQKNDWNGDWKRYSRENKQAVLRKLITNISQLLRTHLSDTRSRLRPILSLGIAEPTKRGDGISIYFQNYPNDADSALLFNEFFIALRKELAKDKVWINIVVTQDVLNDESDGKQGAFSLSNLIKLKKIAPQQGTTVNREAIDEYLFILLNEPSTDAKKLLRANIENEPGLHGNARAEFLRSIVPVMQFDNHNWQQFEDDVVYASDNFGGIGLWAPDFDNIAISSNNLNDSCYRSKQIALCILRNFRDSNQVGKLPSALARFACVNRWYLQLALSVFLVMAIVLAFLFTKYCEVQSLIKRYFLWVLAFNVVPPLMIFLLLLFYDPYLTSLSKGNLPFIVAIGIIFFGIIAGYLYLRSQRDLPQRQRALPQRQGLGFPIIGWTIEVDEHGFRWVIRNRGTGYGIIKKIEILLDGQAVADAKTALEAVLGPDKNLIWKSLPLVGQKIMPGETVIGISITDPDSALAFDKKLREHQLDVMITYFSANNEHWISDGKEVSAIGASSF